jgi:gluconolactonase
MQNRFLLGVAIALYADLPARAQSLGTVALPADLAEANAQVEAVLNKEPGNASKYLGYSEGPAVDADGNLFFSEMDGDRIFKVTPQGVGSVFYSLKHKSNGMEFDPQGRLIVCQQGAIAVLDKEGNRTLLTNTGSGFNLQTLNDITIGSNGAMYLTNHSTGNMIFHRSPSGAITTYPGTKVPNGIEWLEEKKILLVASSDDSKVYQFDVAEDGALSNKRDFAPVPVPDGMTADEKGNIYVASWSQGVIHVLSPAGQALGKITVKNPNPGDPYGAGGNTSTCAFGGPGNKTLYITGDGGAYKVQLKVAGRVRPGSTLVKARSRTGAVAAPKASFAPRAAQVILFAPTAGGNRRDARGSLVAIQSLPRP